MVKRPALALVAACLLGSAVPLSAQTIDIGPGGPRIDMRSPGERARERELRREDREFRREREMRRRERMSGPGCRTVEIRERDAYGDMVVRRRRECRD